MLEVISLTVEVCGKRLVPYIDDMVKILERTIVDPFPDAKRESCKCTISFAKTVPEHFHMQAESLVKPLMQTIAHQHSRVRVAVIEATGAVIQHGTGKNVDDVLSHLAQRLFDNSPQVRKAVTLVVGDWLLNLRDRYSYFHKLIPLLLSSYHDEIPEISQMTADLWRQVGAQWERENEDDLKDKMDFLLTPPALYPPGVERPGLGCRELVVRNLSRLMPAVSRDMGDWLVGTRVKTAQLLALLLLHAEDHCTQHLQPLLSTLYHACADPEKEVVKPSLGSAQLLGTFVGPEALLKLLLAHVESASSTSPSAPWVPLMVLRAALRGSSGEALHPHLQRLADTLALPEVCQETQQAVYLEQVLECVDALLEVCAGDSISSVSLQLLKVLISVESLASEEEIRDRVEVCVRSLCEVQGVSAVCEVYRRHMSALLEWLSHTHHSWTGGSLQRTQLEVALVRSGPVIGEFLPLLLPLLQSCLQPSRDPEMRLHLFTMLSKMLLNAPHTLDSQGRFHEHVDVFVCECVLPNLVWQGGRTAAAIRTSALSCLLALLTGGAIATLQLLSFEDRLTPLLVSALDEDSQMCRLLACQSLSTLLKLTGADLQPDTLNKIYPEVLKRVDDGNEEVRVSALKALGVWLSSLGKNYNSQSNQPHLEFLFQQLLLYLDDPDSRVQEATFEVLKAGSAVHPSLMQKEVEGVRDKQRCPIYCDKLLQHIQSVS
ncbi:dynein axonemal assembly factor 5 isoform X2 [Clupea harengus]|nr:dynein axonemal assembly factor 5 isoform X2 [Clupea harengus]